MRTKIIKRNEVYPVEYLSGFPAFSYRQAVCFKAKKEREIKCDPNKVQINLEIIPVPDRQEEYYVHNTSTYVMDVTSFEKLDMNFSLPSWAKIGFQSPFVMSESIPNSENFD